MRQLLALIVLSGAVGCGQPPSRGGGFGPVVRVCDGDRCGDRLTADTSRMPEPDRRGERQQDPDAYRGESLADLQAAAREGDPRAAYTLGLVQVHGLAGMPRDPRLGQRNLEAAAAAGHPWAQYQLGQMLLDLGRDRARGIELTFAAARAGIAPAAHDLALMHMQGRGVARDPAEAARWFRQAAENGVPEAQYNFGLLYYRGEGVQRQLHEALQWTRQAAAGGYLPAQKAVGRLYMTGLDTMGQDLEEARTWLALAAGRGDAESQRLLREVDGALAAEREHGRRLQMLAVETRAYWASAVLAAALAPRVSVLY